MSKTPAKTARRKQPRKASNYSRFTKGLMSKREKIPLAIAARQAFDYQASLGNINDGTKFDEWRRDQVMDVAGKAGLRQCHHNDFKPLMAHFKELAGRDDQAFAHHMTSGDASDKAEPGDTHESRRQRAHLIMEELRQHIWLAEILPPDLAEHTNDPKVYNDLRARRASILAHSKGAIREGYLVRIARDKTSRKDLQLGTDIQAGLAERCTIDQLEQIHFTIVNRIRVREGRPESEQGRNKSRRRSSAPKSESDQKSVAQRSASVQVPGPDESCNAPAPHMHGPRSPR